jgi:hypothetical protein
MLGEGMLGSPMWRVDDGPVHGLSFEECEATRVLSESDAQTDPSWAFWPETPGPHSCANVSYTPGRLYARDITLLPGEHTLHVGLNSRSGEVSRWLGASWIDIVDLVEPVFPFFTEVRPRRGLGAGGALVPDCLATALVSPNQCRVDHGFWMQIPFSVAVGHGGAIATHNNITIDTVSCISMPGIPWGILARVTETSGGRSTVSLINLYCEFEMESSHRKIVIEKTRR